ncbi:hypothetical protein HK103_000514 [Boothiomyces macroporosus]|uniref:SH3 domain-containing protein n=1 Tax=Boothiomyces macroporosus TaxID=261099 RepID=A0AAD5UBS6_9FUNG|nr:hypothetical protein HK103_000514 [Boothiomyces macroporosus]
MPNDCDILYGQYSFYKKTSKRQLWGSNPIGGASLAPTGTLLFTDIPSVTSLQPPLITSQQVTSAPSPTAMVRQPLWCCTSPGVTCSSDRYTIVALDLSNQNYYGTITSDIFKFTSLQTLNMSFNFLSGEFPQIPASSSLKQIDFQSNGFTAFDGFLSNNLVQFNFENNPGIQFKTSIASLNEQNSCCVKVQGNWVCSQTCTSTPSAAPATTTPPSSNNNDSSSAPVAAILGWVLGLLLLVVIIGFLVYRHFTNNKGSKSPKLGAQEHQQQNIVEIAALVRSITDRKPKTSDVKSDPSEEDPFLPDKIEVIAKDPIDIPQNSAVPKLSVDSQIKEFSIRSNEILDVKPLKSPEKHVDESTGTDTSDATSIYDETSSNMDDIDSATPEILNTAPVNEELSRDVLNSIIEITSDKMNDEEMKVYYATTQEEDATVIENVVKEYYFSFERKKTVLHLGDRKNLIIGLGDKLTTFVENPAATNSESSTDDEDNVPLFNYTNKLRNEANDDSLTDISTACSESSTSLNIGKDAVSAKLQDLCTEIQKSNSDDCFPEREKTVVNSERTFVCETVTEDPVTEIIESNVQEAKLFEVDKKYTSLPRLHSKKKDKSDLIRRKTAITARELELKENATKRSKSFNVGSADPLKLAKKRNTEVKHYFETKIYTKVGVPTTAIYSHEAEPNTHEIDVYAGDRIQVNRHGHNGWVAGLNLSKKTQGEFKLYCTPLQTQQQYIIFMAQSIKGMGKVLQGAAQSYPERFEIVYPTCVNWNDPHFYSTKLQRYHKQVCIIHGTFRFTQKVSETLKPYADLYQIELLIFTY